MGQIGLWIIVALKKPILTKLVTPEDATRGLRSPQFVHHQHLQRCEGGAKSLNNSNPRTDRADLPD
jgi:hypothetical protein